MSLIYNIPNDDIDLFVNSYNSNLLNGTVNNPKLPSYVLPSLLIAGFTLIAV